ncbi:MAG: NAD-dependent epimerase/dehydratase family protein, partial [Bacteroidales bacterium]|nr:NAD-dependent epimerase/dehydratase family protein [Bacteroidales bacterium]
MILLTGGTGLVGSHLLFEHTREGKNVRALKRKGSRIDIVEKIFEWYNPEKYRDQFNLIEWVDGDLSDIFSLRDALQGVNHVYHCAAV